jgi:lactobin A/cerein 7B family class IIb bacteriocin
MKNLESLGVQELNTKEIKEINGGFLGILIAVTIIIAAGIFANDGKDNTQVHIGGERVGR